MTGLDRPDPPLDELTAAILACHRYCDTHGGNLPDLLSVALMDAAVDLGGSYALIAHRPGSWEATHVQALAAGADYKLDLDRERPY